MKAFFGVFVAMALFFGSFSAVARTVYETCNHCDPGSENDNQVRSILASYPSLVAGDKIAIQDNQYENVPPPGHSGYYQVTWTKTAHGWVQSSSGYNPVAGGGNGGGGEGGNPGNGNGGGYVPPGAGAGNNGGSVVVGPIGDPGDGGGGGHHPCGTGSPGSPPCPDNN